MLWIDDTEQQIPKNENDEKDVGGVYFPFKNHILLVISQT